MSAEAPKQRRGLLDRLIGLAVVAGGFAKFAAFFVSFAAYSVWFGSWQFGLGFVLLILVHELGHVAEAKRQGLPVTLPTFIPFFGAFVTVRHAGVPPWRSALVSLAGPFAGGLAAAAVWAVGAAENSTLLVVLANIGFLLNLANLAPIWIFDGAAVWRAVTHTWQMPRIRYENGVPVEALPPDREHAVIVAVLYFLLAAALLGGLLATRHSGML